MVGLIQRWFFNSWLSDVAEAGLLFNFNFIKYESRSSLYIFLIGIIVDD